MKFDLNKSLEILERTPAAIETLLKGISGEWIMNNEGPDTWSPFDIIGHLIHGEKADWIARMEIILSDSSDKTFEPFDRFAQFENSRGKSLEDLLLEFKTLRRENLEYLRSRQLSENHLARTGIHPEFGEVSLSQLLSTWVAHDLNHIAQIVRAMSKQYKTEVGPWIKYLRILQS